MTCEMWALPCHRFLTGTYQNLSSNPKGPLDDALKEKFAKSEK